MKLFSLVWLVGCVLGLVVGTGGWGMDGEAAVVLTASVVVDRVESRNPQVLLNRESIARARARSEQTRAGMLPRVDARISQQRSQGTTGAGTTAGDRRDRFEGKLVGEYLLFDAREIAEVRASRTGEEVARLDYEVTLQDLLEEALRAYLTHARNLSRLEVVEANLERDRLLLDLARRQLQAGVATEIDVTRAQVGLARNEREHLRARLRIVESELDLKRLLDLDLGTAVEIGPIDGLMDFMDDRGGQEMIDGFLGVRSEWRAAEERLRELELGQRAAGWQRAPSLSLIGEYGVGSERAFDGEEESLWLVGARVDVPVFEGRRIRGEQREAAALVRAQRFAIRDLRRTLEAEARFSTREVQSLREQLEVSEKEVGLSRRELELARARFEQGVTDNQEVVVAQAALAQAEDGWVEARFQLQSGMLALARVAGDVRYFVEGFPAAGHARRR